MKLIQKIFTTLGIFTLVGGLTYPVHAQPTPAVNTTLVAQKHNLGIYVGQPRRFHRGKFRRGRVYIRRPGRINRRYVYRRYPGRINRSYIHKRYPGRINRITDLSGNQASIYVYKKGLEFKRVKTLSICRLLIQCRRCKNSKVTLKLRQLG